VDKRPDCTRCYINEFMAMITFVVLFVKWNLEIDNDRTHVINRVRNIRLVLKSKTLNWMHRY